MPGPTKQQFAFGETAASWATPVGDDSARPDIRAGIW
jgi:hypothetical protein